VSVSNACEFSRFLARATFMIDPLHLAIAVTPLGGYLLLLGLLRFRSRPKVVSGVKDTVWVGIAISGFVVAGPMELFMPEAAALRFHGFVWILLLGLYAMLVTLWALLMRPRVIIYNISADALRPVLSEVVGQLDRDVRWAGQGVILPTLGVQLSIESDLASRSAQLVAAGSQQSYAGWRQLEHAFREQLRTVPGARSGHALLLVLSGIALLGMAGAALAFNREQSIEAWQAFLRQ